MSAQDEIKEAFKNFAEVFPVYDYLVRDFIASLASFDAVSRGAINDSNHDLHELYLRGKYLRAWITRTDSGPNDLAYVIHDAMAYKEASLRVVLLFDNLRILGGWESFAVANCLPTFEDESHEIVNHWYRRLGATCQMMLGANTRYQQTVKTTLSEDEMLQNRIRELEARLDVWEKGRTMTARELALHLGIPKSTLLRYVQALKNRSGSPMVPKIEGNKQVFSSNQISQIEQHMRITRRNRGAPKNK